MTDRTALLARDQQIRDRARLSDFMRHGFTGIHVAADVATADAIALLLNARRALYSDRQLTIRQADMRARRINNAVARLEVR